MSASAEERLYQKAQDFLSSSRGIRHNRTEDIFERKLYIVSDRDIQVKNYQRERPKMAFNPGATLDGKTLVVFPRLIFDYYTYTSSIGRFSLNMEEVLGGTPNLPVKCDVILWPKKLWEFRGCEDARVFKRGDQTMMLYTGYGYFVEDRNMSVAIVQAFVEFDGKWRPKERNYLSVKSIDGGFFVPKANKDSAIVSLSGDEARLLTRPLIKDIEIGWRGVADLGRATMDERTMQPSLAFEEWELKVGWSTNVVKMSSNEYLVGWHGIVTEDYSYREGLAMIDDEGQLLAVSDYLLAPKGVNEEYGDRPLVIFGNGLIRHEDQLVWIGGVCDYAIGVFVTGLDTALDKLRRVVR